jgi:hypothetical protein
MREARIDQVDGSSAGGVAVAPQQRGGVYLDARAGGDLDL